MRSSRVEEQMAKLIDSLAALRGDVRAVRECAELMAKPVCYVELKSGSDAMVTDHAFEPSLSYPPGEGCAHIVWDNPNSTMADPDRCRRSECDHITTLRPKFDNVGEYRVHDPSCDVLDRNPDGIRKPCNCFRALEGLKP
jgi:hypothetical protein